MGPFGYLGFAAGGSSLGVWSLQSRRCAFTFVILVEKVWNTHGKKAVGFSTLCVPLDYGKTRVSTAC